MSRFIRITRGAPGSYNSLGLEVLRCALWVDGKEVANVPVISGIAGRQNFRTLANEKRGMFEPIPEGRYRQIGSPEWAGKPGDHTTKWSEPLGAVVIEIYGDRAIMLHLDGGAPGSAGCICPQTIAHLNTILSWWAAGKPDFVECDWGLGTITPPVAAPVPKTEWIKIFANDGRSNAYRASDEIDSQAVRVDYQKGRLSAVSLNNQIVPLDQVVSLQLLLQIKKK